MNSCWLPLVHTLALLRTWPCTLSYGVFSYTQPHTRTHTHTHTYTHTHTHTHTHTLMYIVLAHTSYTCGKHLSDDGANTLTHKICHMHMYSIQFNCTCACLYRPLILCKFVYQAFCTCIVHCVPIWSSTCTQTLHTCITHTPLYTCTHKNAHTQHIDTHTHTHIRTRTHSQTQAQTHR